MTAMEVLIEHGQTPSGFGLVAYARHTSMGEEGWYFRPTSPCCGAFIDTDNGYMCVNCRESYVAYQDGCRGTIGNDVPFVEGHTDDNTTFERWIARVMDFPDSEGTHNVKVSIAWTD